MFEDMQQNFLVRSGAKFSSEYLLAKIGFDTAESGPLKGCQKLPKSQKKS